MWVREGFREKIEFFSWKFSWAGLNLRLFFGNSWYSFSRLDLYLRCEILQLPKYYLANSHNHPNSHTQPKKSHLFRLTKIRLLWVGTVSYFLNLYPDRWSHTRSSSALRKPAHRRVLCRSSQRSFERIESQFLYFRGKLERSYHDQVEIVRAKNTFYIRIKFEF